MNVFFIVSDEGTSLEHVHPLLSPIVSQVIVDTRCQMRTCLLYTSPSPRDATLSRMPSSA